MDFTLMPSLERLALTRIVTLLCYQDDVRCLLVTSSRSEFDTLKKLGEWEKLEEIVREKVMQLPLPGPLKDKTLGLIKPIGLEIFRWLYNHVDSFFDTSLPNELCWTPQGTVDEQRTTEMLIKDENLNIYSRYKIACVFCLEDDIRELWKKIPPRHHQLFYQDQVPRLVKQHEIVLVWTYDLMGKLENLNVRIQDYWDEVCSPYQHAFRCAVGDGNKAAARHFLRKLPSAEREECLGRLAGWLKTMYPIDTFYSQRGRGDMLCFVLSQMNEKQQEQVFMDWSYKILCILLNWPCQDLFIETAKRMWGLLTEDNFRVCLNIILIKVMRGFEDYDYQKLFKEFWKQSPIKHRKYVIDTLDKCRLLIDLFEIEDKENIELVLEDASIAERENIIFSNIGKSVCKDLAANDERDLLKFFVRQCLPCNSMMITKLRKEFEEHVADKIARATLDGEDTRSNFYEIMDEVVNDVS